MSTIAEAQALYKSGRFDEAERIGRTILATDPENADALNVVAVCLLMTGRWGDALPLLQRVVQLRPKYSRALANLAFLELERRDFPLAECLARRAIEHLPTLAAAHVTLGRAMAEQGRKDDGAAQLRRAIELDPKNVDGLYWLGYIAGDAGFFDEAGDYFTRALAINPNHLPSIYMLALGQHKLGLIDDAIATYARGVEISPHDASLHSNLILAKTFHPTISERELFDELARWNRAHGNPPANEIIAHAVDRKVDRPLRIGYVSPFFQEHSIAFFVEAIVANHDQKRFPVAIYTDLEHGDATTERFKKLAGTWRETRGMTDAALAEMIRQDRIDILVDLTQHSGGSRLGMFARKPAPVQVAYLGYPNTTGLPVIDYRLTDRFLEPPGAESLSSEKLIRLESYFCYRAPDRAPEILQEPPCAKRGYVTFVSQNPLVKLNDVCIAGWSRVLSAVKDSRLTIKAAGCAAPAAQQRYRAMFAARGIDPARIEFRTYTPLRDLMLELNDADIALDAFPYNGGTTTCHILWMGVPVVSLAGSMPVHRMGLSILSQVGLEDLVASGEEEFVEIAVKLAGDRDRLRELRRTLRDRMRSSPLMDAPRFVRKLEESFTEMWKSG